MPLRPKDRIVCEFFHWNLFRREGVWYADGRQNRPPLGKNSLGGRDRNAALSALRELDRNCATKLGLLIQSPPTHSQELGLSATWQKYLDHVGRPDVLGGAGALTMKRYGAVRNKHRAFCEGEHVCDWRNIDQKHVSAYGTYLQKLHYSDATIYLECTLLKQVVKWLIEEEKALPPSQQIRFSLRRSQESTTYRFSRDEIRSMIDFCRADEPLHLLGDVLLALATTGMRVGELAGLRWSDVDFAIGTIALHDTRHSGRHHQAEAVRTTQGRRGRRIPIHSRLLDLLKTMRHRADGRVFGMPRGGRLLPNSCLKMFIRHVIAPLTPQYPTPAGEIGFADGRLHSFRHAFVSQAFLDGASEGEIREWVGHTYSRIVERYRHLRNDDGQRKMGRIDFLGDATPS